MTTPLHHPFGPSQVEAYDPQSDGCAALEPARDGNHAEAEAGTLTHLAVSSGDTSILEGDCEAETLVAKAREFLRRDGARMDGKEKHEVLLSLGEVNYGTADYLKFNQDATRALLGDLKFGWWSVSPARKNLQLLNYAAAAFYTYPSLQRILGAIYQIRKGVATYRWFARRYYPRYFERIERIVANATRARQDPRPKDFTPHPANCSFCARIACPARIALASSLVSAWHKEPISLSQPFSLTKLSLDHLGALKRLNGALKAFTAAVDAEAKRRAVDEGNFVPGYELRQRQGTRTITGVNIQLAASVIAETWGKLYPDQEDLPINELMMGLIEVGMHGLEAQIAKHAPKGTVTRAQQAISDALEEAHLVQQVPQWILAAIKT